MKLISGVFLVVVLGLACSCSNSRNDADDLHKWNREKPERGGDRSGWVDTSDLFGGFNPLFFMGGS